MQTFPPGTVLCPEVIGCIVCGYGRSGNEMTNILVSDGVECVCMRERERDRERERERERARESVSMRLSWRRFDSIILTVRSLDPLEL